MESRPYEHGCAVAERIVELQKRAYGAATGTLIGDIQNNLSRARLRLAELIEELELRPERSDPVHIEKIRGMIFVYELELKSLEKAS